MADKITINPVQAGNGLETAINARLQQIEDAFNDNVLWRAGAGLNPNTMANDLDMGGQDILNVNWANATDTSGKSILYYVGEAANSATAADASATAAATSEANAAASATAAATSASTAQAALDGTMFRDVDYKVFADSPYAVSPSTDGGTLFSVDTSGGNVVINLPEISGLTTPFAIGVKKTTADANTITINRAGTDEIDGGASFTVSGENSGAFFVADSDATPDEWTSVEVGAGTLADGSVTNAKLAANAVTTDKIQDRTIASADINFGAITDNELSSGPIISPEQLKTHTRWEMQPQRNIIHNPEGKIWQRSADAKVVGVASGGLGADRWSYQGVSSAAVVDFEKWTTSVPADTYFDSAVGLDVTTGDATIGAGQIDAIAQVIFWRDLKNYSPKTNDLWFQSWVRVSRDDYYCITLMSPNGESYIYEFLPISSGFWELIQFPIPKFNSFTEQGSAVTDLNNPALYVFFMLSAGSTYNTGTSESWNTGTKYATSNQCNGVAANTDYYQFTGVQLEAAPTGFTTNPPQYIYTDYDYDLAQCQRYFQKSWRYDEAVGTANLVGSHKDRSFNTGAHTCYGFSAPLPVQMGYGPTITWYNPNTGTANQLYNETAAGAVTVTGQVDGSETHLGPPTISTATTVGDVLAGHWTADTGY